MQPADLVNRCLDAIGNPNAIGDLQEGTREAQVALRHYGSVMRQLFRAAHWNFARFRAPLTMLNDATGATTQYQQQNNLEVTVGTGTYGMRPWSYEYAWPVNCVKVRYIPAHHGGPGAGTPAGNIAISPNPIMSGVSGANNQFVRPHPSPFLVTQDAIPNLIGAITDWSQVPDTSQTMGQGATNQTVILSNQPHAEAVYTALVTSPDQWDPLFQEAFCAVLATYLAMPLVPDRKASLSVRNEQAKIAMRALDQARVADGNEGWAQADIVPDWLRIRNSGGYGRGEYRDSFGGGVLFGGWDGCGMGNGAVY